MTTLPHGNSDCSSDELPGADLPNVGDRVADNGNWVEVYARAHLPTRFGQFDIFVFRDDASGNENVVLTRGVLHGQADVPVRIHSECLTGDALGSLRCDCREQLEIAMLSLGSGQVGALLYLRQEGRGIGLGNKIRAYALQETGLDTYEANRHLGFDDDLRDYRTAALILRLFGPTSVRLVTNNPRKVFGLRKEGIEITTRQPLVTVANPYNESYLRTKARKSGHLLPIA